MQAGPQLPGNMVGKASFDPLDTQPCHARPGAVLLFAGQHAVEATGAPVGAEMQEGLHCGNLRLDGPTSTDMSL